MTTANSTARHQGRKIKHRRPLPNLWSKAALALFLVLMVLNLAPIIWGILTSLKSEAELFRFPPVLFDFTPTLDNYKRVIESGFGQSLKVSVLYSGVTVFFVLLFAVPAAYAFDRFEFFGRRFLFLLIVASIPLSLGAAALLIPNYIYFQWLGLNNHFYTLPLIYTAHQLPMAIWIVKGTIEGIPKELDEAAIADGASHFTVLRLVILPLCLPALGAAGVMTFVGTWNEFVASTVMVDDPSLRAVQPAIYNFIGYFGREWGPLTAAAMMGVLPVLLTFLMLGRLIISGLTKGSVKG
ncbi:carbohydrate ABC transporter permease [Paracoccus sp. (in: a-proteobacteria)]|uniref:carbohydrate ABC transporter permease n=1 Tax=Paracoccus sp. TaxID=267 RepID=UPI0028B1509D|nr:carbohydrate ABC transporter permease [Paracoccus sp. (in: a-proteobacteria)]